VSQERQPEASPGVELLLRLVADELRTSSCAGCGGSLIRSRVALRDQDPGQVVIEVVCRSCDEPLLLRVEPEAESGIAGVR